MGVALARADNVDKARQTAKHVSETVKIEL
jgi:formate-dependent phosphoribosylglycinamide formyltransferase (GAR transformylase)